MAVKPSLPSLEPQSINWRLSPIDYQTWDFRDQLRREELSQQQLQRMQSQNPQQIQQAQAQHFQQPQAQRSQQQQQERLQQLSVNQVAQAPWMGLEELT